MSYLGRPLKRKEDPRLLTGRGRFVADVRLAGMLEAAVLRSTEPHARVGGIEAARARRMPGVVAVFTGADLAGRVKPFDRLDHEETFYDQGETIRPQVKRFLRPVLAGSTVYRVGEPLAIVVAETRYAAQDALEAITVDYEPLPPLTDPEAALAPGAETIGAEMQSWVLGDGLHGNVQSRFCVDCGDVARAFREADGTFAETFRMPRQVGSPMETRGIVAAWEPDRPELSVWSTTQLPHLLRARLAGMLGLPAEIIHVIGADMGGSFGGGVWNEDIAIPFIARELGRPVRWIESRSENLMNARHSRGQETHVEVAYRRDGRILGLRCRIVVDCGVYSTSPMTCIYNTAAHMRGEYRIDHYHVEGLSVLTNKTPHSPVRGAGRQEGAFVMDRVLDLVAERLEMDPAEVRRRNLIPASAMPFDAGMYYRDGHQLVYDSGDYPAQFEAALEKVGYRDFRARQAAWRAEGRKVGIGLSSYLEGTGAGPHEGALVRVDGSGQVFVYSGSKNHGQSHETTLAQVCADALGATYDQVTVWTGDTRLVPHGGGTAASRSAVTAGMAVAGAAQRVREKIRAVAATLLEAHPDDLEISEGRIHPKGSPTRAITFRDVAQATMPGPRARLPRGMDPGLEAQYYWVPPAVTFASGTQVAVVEVDDETGLVTLLRYVVVHDCGKPMNVQVVEGQIHGAVVHGISGAMYEEVVYDEHGQLLTGTLMDYALPVASNVPSIELGHQEFPSGLNALGIKGVGEGGVASPPGAIANAIVDALRPLRINITELPITPERLRRLIEGARR